MDILDFPDEERNVLLTNYVHDYYESLDMKCIRAILIDYFMKNVDDLLENDPVILQQEIEDFYDCKLTEIEGNI